MTASLCWFEKGQCVLPLLHHWTIWWRWSSYYPTGVLSTSALPGDWLSTTPDTAVAATTGVKPQPTPEQRNLQACAWRNLRFPEQFDYLGCVSQSVVRIPNSMERGRRMILRHFHVPLFHFRCWEEFHHPFIWTRLSPLYTCAKVDHSQMHSLREMKDCTISLSAADWHCVCTCGGGGGSGGFGGVLVVVVGGGGRGWGDGGGGPPLLVMVDQAQHCTGGLSAGKRWLLTEH